MAADANTPGAQPPNPPSFSRVRQAAEKAMPPAGPPSSKALQIFLLIALVITGGAYVVDQWTEMTTEQATAPHPSKLRRMAAQQAEYIDQMEAARQAESRNNFTEAVIHYRRALLAQDLAEGHLALGAVMLKEGNPDMAFSQFKDALRLSPGMPEAYAVWGEALLRQGKTDDAEQVYQDALRQYPKLGVVHYLFARALERKQQVAVAAEREAEESDQAPEGSRHAAEAQLYASDALKHYAEAEKLAVNTTDFWFNYGSLLNRLGKYAEAEQRLIRAEVLEPTNGQAQFQLALAQDRQGNYADAIGHYESTLAAMPDDPPTLNSVALLYATATNEQARSPKMAVLLATRACDATSEQNARFLDTLARAYAADGEFSEAIAAEDKAVRRAEQIGDRELLRELKPRFDQFFVHKKE